MAFNMATLSREQKTCGFNLFNLQGNLDISLLQSHGCVFCYQTRGHSLVEKNVPVISRFVC